MKCVRNFIDGGSCDNEATIFKSSIDPKNFDNHMRFFFCEHHGTSIKIIINK